MRDRYRACSEPGAPKVAVSLLVYAASEGGRRGTRIDQEKEIPERSSQYY